jgi:O-antigen biosynthesis protein
MLDQHPPSTPEVSSRQLTLVLGMHRSGTSALAGVLHKLGLVLGESLLPPAEDNPKGFFENSKIVSIQQRLLSSLGRDWHEPLSLPEGWGAAKAARSAADQVKVELSRMFEQGDRLLVKDPRASLFVPLWSTVAGEMECALGTVVMVRSPFEVIASLAKRDGMSFRRAGLLWLRYMLQAEHDTRGIPRIFVSYRAFMTDWRREIARIAAALSFDLHPNDARAAQVDDFLDQSLHRNRDIGKPGPDYPELVRLLMDAERALFAMCIEGGSTSSEDFDELAARLQEMTEGYAEVVRLEREYAEQTTQAAAFGRLWRPSVPTRDTVYAKVYWREDARSYSEENARSVSLESKDGNFLASFLIPVGAKLDFLRFDPDETSGIFAVSGILFDGTPVTRLQDLVTHVNQLQLSPAYPGGLRISALDGDPYLEIDLRKSDVEVVGGSSVQYQFHRESPARFFEERLSGLSEQVKGLSESFDATRGRFEEVSHLARRAVDATDTGTERLALLQLEMQKLAQEVTMSKEWYSAGLTGMQSLFSADLAGMRTVFDVNLEATRAVLEALRAELAEARDNQRVLRAWAERRTFTYWWRRLRRSPYVRN